jgi:hypothetical protein
MSEASIMGRQMHTPLAAMPQEIWRGGAGSGRSGSGRSGGVAQGRGDLGQGDLAGWRRVGPVPLSPNSSAGWWGRPRGRRQGQRLSPPGAPRSWGGASIIINHHPARERRTVGAALRGGAGTRGRRRVSGGCHNKRCARLIGTWLGCAVWPKTRRPELASAPSLSRASANAPGAYAVPRTSHQLCWPTTSTPSS